MNKEKEGVECLCYRPEFWRPRRAKGLAAGNSHCVRNVGRGGKKAGGKRNVVRDDAGVQGRKEEGGRSLQILLSLKPGALRDDHDKYPRNFAGSLWVRCPVRRGPTRKRGEVGVENR